MSPEDAAREVEVALVGDEELWRAHQRGCLVCAKRGDPACCPDGRYLLDNFLHRIYG